MKYKQVIMSILDLPGNLVRVKFLSLNGHGTILKDFTCNINEAKEWINIYCRQYGYTIV